MEIITVESQAYKDLVEKIEKIAAFVAKKESYSENYTDREIWLDSQELANLLRVSTKTIQRLRKDNLISYTILRGRCLYRLSDIEKGMNDRIITCKPSTLDEYRKNFLLKNRLK